MSTLGLKVNWTAIASTAAIIMALAQNADAVNAIGGDITLVDVDGYFIHTFTNSGTLEVNSGGNVEVLVVAGGGGGGGGAMSGGGGAGGLVYTSSYPVVVGNISIVVGSGGLGGYAYNLADQAGTQGDNSSFGTGIVAIGGGGGAGWDNNPATSGGSGGGGNSSQAAALGTAGQGHAGNIGSATSTKRSGGGGGGAGAAGELGVAGAGGAGGDGIEVFGSYYGGSGGASKIYGHGGHGGGLVRVVARRYVTIDGTVNADAGVCVGNHSSGGSGGGMLIDCARFAGAPSGLLSANGGNGTSTAKSNDGGGGGGRIAIWTGQPYFEGISPSRVTEVDDLPEFDGVITADGGTSTTANREGQPGTIAFFRVTAPAGTVFMLK